MAYRIDFRADPGFTFYLEIVLRNRKTGNPMKLDGIDHRLNVVGRCLDYGDWQPCSWLLASNANGLITVPAKGVLAISIPFANFGLPGTPLPDYGQRCGASCGLRYTLSAISATPSTIKPERLLARGELIFGVR